MLKIESITITKDLDEYPDTSCIGEYTDDLREGVIVRSLGDFYEKLPAEMERDTDGTFLCKGEPYNLPAKGREYRGFIPYAGGEKTGTANYYKYGMQDFERMEGRERGDWYFIGVHAEATVKAKGEGDHCRLEELTSAGLWGIESDAGDEYLLEIAQEELGDLKDHLGQFNVDVSDFDQFAKDAIDNMG